MSIGLYVCLVMSSFHRFRTYPTFSHLIYIRKRFPDIYGCIAVTSVVIPSFAGGFLCINVAITVSSSPKLPVVVSLSEFLKVGY